MIKGIGTTEEAYSKKMNLDLYFILHKKQNKTKNPSSWIIDKLKAIW